MSRALAIGLVRRQLVEQASDPGDGLFADSSATLRPGVRATIAKYLHREFRELTALVDYCEFLDYLRPGGPAGDVRVGLGDEVVAAMLDQFGRCGGTRIRGRVTDLVTDGSTCRGVRYEQAGVSGHLLCDDVVLASGGFCGLFADGVGINSGYLMGTYARHGGVLANLEMFARFALGNLDRKVPVYPFEFNGPPRLLRADEPAAELLSVLAACEGDFLDLSTFHRYWLGNLDVPHTATSAQGAFRLAPIRGFSMGGMVRSAVAGTLSNVHAIGECAYDLAVDSVSGKPLATYLAYGGMLADELAERTRPPSSSSPASPGVDAHGVDAHGVDAPGDARLREEIEQGLSAFQDTRFSIDAAARFVRWCRDERRARRGELAGNEDLDLLILAEAYACSVLVRTESRGFFHRPDFPAPDPALAGKVTMARYDAKTDQVVASMVRQSEWD
ncbi:MAG: acyl-CoA synthetase [Kibdelosporangium sp.]